MKNLFSYLSATSYHFKFLFQARKNLLAVFQSIVDERRKLRKECSPMKAKDMMDALLDVEDDNGRKLPDEEIIDVMLMYLNAGHESSGHITMWATYFLQKHPEYLQKAKVSSYLIIIFHLDSQLLINNKHAHLSLHFERVPN